MEGFIRKSCFCLLAFLLLMFSIASAAQQCRPSGRVRIVKSPPSACERESNLDCCEEGKYYNTYKCSPPVTNHTRAYMTRASFEENGDISPFCDGRFHSDNELVVALSTGWFDNERRCLRNITVSGNGKRVVALVVDECDSTIGCDADHDYQPPCGNNIVEASKAVWKALGVPGDKRDGLDIIWSDA